MKNPRDATAKDVAKLRKEVKSLQKKVENEARYNGKRFEGFDYLIYQLQLHLGLAKKEKKK